MTCKPKGNNGEDCTSGVANSCLYPGQLSENLHRTQLTQKGVSETTFPVLEYENTNHNLELSTSISITFSVSSHKKSLLGFSTLTTTFSGLEAYWNYTFSVAAVTDKGNSEQSDLSATVTTDQDAPGKVTNFEIKRPANIFTTMEVSWAMPLLRERNGIIKEYKISHNISGTVTTDVVTAVESVQKLYSITPDRYYMIEIFAVNTLNQAGEKVRKIYYASSKIEEQAPVSIEGYSIETVVGAAVGCVLFSVLIMMIVVSLIMKRKKTMNSEQSSLRLTQGVSQIGNQCENDNISLYQEIGNQENTTVYDQLDTMHTLDNQYENMMLRVI
ncbi:Hypothetical predicted protein [Mytilus galloprovincialis]|uniref:Fibronectin type-III domain-containing protein n=1 Tax=Mytilus galloprovincialis TaxID=29158 RepID=A0A8B6BW13_MYTGA|nr:Hypothetical predicted protein [Mytilus galloprovincialis]